MSSASNPEGLAIARELIAREAEERTGFLDLGRLGLKAMPEELRKLTQLRGLNLGSAWDEPQSGRRHFAAHVLEANDMRGGWEGLGALTRLEALRCYRTLICDLQPLAQLTALRELYCADTLVSDLQPLSQLAALTTLKCSGTLVSNVQPLAKLTALTRLHCSETQVSDLQPLASLPALSSLECLDTQVSDLQPLAKIATLTTLDCSDTQVREFPAGLIWHPTLTRFVAHGLRIEGLPANILSADEFTNCLESLRGHFRDLHPGE